MTKYNISFEIEKELRKQELSVQAFADRIYCSKANAYNILKRSTMDIELLAVISRVLNRNFVMEYAKAMEG